MNSIIMVVIKDHDGPIITESIFRGTGDRTKAHDRAAEIARENPGVEVHVLQSVGYYKTPSPVAVFTALPVLPGT